jgi:hypothetical protein
MRAQFGRRSTFPWRKEGDPLQDKGMHADEQTNDYSKEKEPKREIEELTTAT